jgi:uncharacterized membrane protein
MSVDEALTYVISMGAVPPPSVPRSGTHPTLNSSPEDLACRAKADDES